MNRQATFAPTVLTLTVILSCCACSSSAFALEANVIRTNWVERWITNVIEVRMPLNRFVNEYRTNWVTEFRTNAIEVYATNRLTRTITNRLAVDAFRTNLVSAYYTNWKTLDLTNWQTAIVLRTNWVTQTLTNTVQTEAHSPAADPAPIVPSNVTLPMETRTATSSSVPSAAKPCPVVLEVIRTASRSNTGQVEVRLRVRGQDGRASLLPVQQWRVEREDRAILCFGQDQEFKRDLPPGRYKIEVKIPQAEDGSLLTARGTLVVGPHEVFIEKNLAANN